jgi:beta-lactamase regulating signal transducer with metallopeptidase domain
VTDSIISTALSTGLAVTALLALVLLTRRAVTCRFGARVAYALWLLPIIRLFTPQISLPSNWALARWVKSLSGQTVEPAPIYVGYYDGVIPFQAEPTSLAFADIWPSALIVTWLLGIIIGSLWVIARQRLYARRLRRMSLTPDTALTVEISRALKLSGLTKAPEVRVSVSNDGPMVCGLFRPIIILPAAFNTQFSPAQRNLALLHELAHVRRGDLWSASAMMVFRLINWPNPLVHLAWPRFRADQEAACDATVLRLTGETARAEYAETLLTAARTAGRANPALGTGLTLSLHHPVKERLMTLGSSTNTRRGASRWSLAALLLTGAALTAPLSFADDPTPPAPDTTTTSTTTQRSVHVVRAEFSEDDKDGYEIRDEDGVKTYIRVSRDGTTENLTREELEAEYDIDVDALLANKPEGTGGRYIARLEGEPGLDAMSGAYPSQRIRTMIMSNTDGQSGGSFEVKVEDGVRRIFRIEEDGTRSEISEDEMGGIVDIETMVVHGDDRFPMVDGEKKIRIFTTSNEMSKWVNDDDEGHSFAFIQGGDHSLAMAGARLQAAQSMLESTDDMLADMRENADGSAQRDLRSAERELEKARRALERARAAVESSSER